MCERRYCGSLPLSLSFFSFFPLPLPLRSPLSFFSFSLFPLPLPLRSCTATTAACEKMQCVQRYCVWNAPWCRAHAVGQRT